MCQTDKFCKDKNPRLSYCDWNIFSTAVLTLNLGLAKAELA